ncbi:hypothetical protein ES703_57592 [subsurface metagenome]
MGLNQGEVHQIEGVRDMSNVKRKFKRMQKGNIKSPLVKSSVEDDILVTSVYYDGKVGLTASPGVAISGDNLALLDRSITQAFKRLPWERLDDLLKIADFVIDQGLVALKETVKED